MPYVQKKKYAKKKMAYKPKHKSAVIQSPLSMPNSKLVKLTYTDTVNLSNSVGALKNHIFHVNNLFDPDFSGIGHQPRYFDTFCGADGGTAPYEFYRVFSAKVTAKFIQDNTGVGAICDVGVNIRPSTAAPPITSNEMREQKKNRSKVLSIASGSNNIMTVTNYASIKKILGINDVKDNSQLLAAYSTGPTSLVSADVWMQPVDGASTTSIYARVTIEFICQFTKMNTTAES